MEKFYENINAINGIKETYKMYCEILNENTKKILDFDNSLNDKQFILYTLNFNHFKIEIYCLSKFKGISRIQFAQIQSGYSICAFIKHSNKS